MKTHRRIVVGVVLGMLMFMMFLLWQIALPLEQRFSAYEVLQLFLGFVIVGTAVFLGWALSQHS
jgi:hypothetical protein